MATDAPTPPPHVPVNYLEKGKSAFFSERCQELLIAAKMNPGWFGSYSKVDKLCVGAKAKCKRWDEATEQERENLAPPTVGDRYLADCQSGHLVRDSNFRESGPSSDGLGRPARGDPCRNVVDGYLEEKAASIPMLGSAQDPQSEHGRHTLNEEADIARQLEHNRLMGLPANAYPEKDRHRDEDNRTQSFLDDHLEKWRTAEKKALAQPQGKGSASGAGAGGSAAGAGGPDDAEGAGLGKVTAPNCAPSDVVDQESAAECINSWRKKAEAQMKQEVVASIDKNKLEHTAPDEFIENRKKPPSYEEQYQDHLDEEARVAKREHKKAKRKYGENDPRTAAVLQARKAKMAEANSFRSAGCLVEQGERMRDFPPGRTTGRVSPPYTNWWAR